MAALERIPDPHRAEAADEIIREMSKFCVKQGEQQ